MLHYYSCFQDISKDSQAGKQLVCPNIIGNWCIDRNQTNLVP